MPVRTTFFIARRYLLAKKSHNAINWVSGISVTGVAVATATMICVMSVFNGFKGLVEQLFTNFDPELRVVLAEGKTVSQHDAVVRRLAASDKIEVCSPVLEENALIRYGEHQRVAVIRGVSDNFSELAHFPDICYGDGDMTLQIDNLHFAIPGVGVLQSMNLPIGYSDMITVYAPKHGSEINMANPAMSFRSDELYASGLTFAVQQEKYDANYIITSLPFAQKLFGQENRISAIELKPKRGVSKSDIEALVDNRFVVQDRYEQQADSFRIMNIEKLISYIFLVFILLVATFNIVGSMSMLILEKTDDIKTLYALGASQRQIRRIFITEGWLISLCGAISGLVLGLVLCFVQENFGLVKLGVSEGNFIVNAYPVSVEWTDVLLVLLTVVAVGFVSALIPVKKSTKK